MSLSKVLCVLLLAVTLAACDSTLSPEQSDQETEDCAQDGGQPEIIYKSGRPHHVSCVRPLPFFQ